MKIFLLRHATPDWARTDIPYDIPPGPPLSPKGEGEALQLAEYLKSQNVTRLYFSPFERSARTARIAAAANDIPGIEDARLSEWHVGRETEGQVRERMLDIFKFAAAESASAGAIGLVTHGGPTALLLEALGVSREDLAEHRKRFDRSNPLPPAGAWKATWDEAQETWDLGLAFTPNGNE